MAIRAPRIMQRKRTMPYDRSQVEPGLYSHITIFKEYPLTVPSTSISSNIVDDDIDEVRELFSLINGGYYL